MKSEEIWGFLTDAVHKTVKNMERKNPAHIEAYFTCTDATEVTIRNSEILTQNGKHDSGVGFRIALSENRVGFACTNKIDNKNVLKAGEEAFEIARVSSSVPNFSLAESTTLPSVKGLFDPRVPEVSPEDVVEIAQRAINSAEGFDKRVIAKDGRVLVESGWVGILNSLRVEYQEKVSRVVLYLGGNGEKDSEVTSSCYDIKFSRAMDLNPEKVGENFGKKVIRLFNPKTIKTFHGAVVFGSEAVSYQLTDVLVDALRGDSVVAGRSVWKGKIGEKVASESLTVIDNPVLEQGFASRTFDDEGCASKKTVMLRKGELLSHLHNATSANALKTSNTGNASRSTGGFDMVKSIIGDGYRTLPIVYPSNLTILPGDKTKEQLASELQKGVLVDSMAGFPQAGSGMVSAQLANAYFIENGEIKYPIKDGMISGVVFEWLKNISDVGQDATQYQNAVVPSLRIEGVKVVGA
jgi:PmbA protein